VLQSGDVPVIVEGIMFRAVWNGAVLAESDHTVQLEGNRYFPAQSLHREYFTASPATSTCPWKGQARYYHIQVDGKTNRDAAWCYPQPSPAAREIAGHVAFWRRVRIGPAPGPGGEAADGASRGLAGRIRSRPHRIGARA
jgi:uncharacterized protein (DUF427 family)